MICKGCQADLKRAVDIPLRINHGRLVVICPLCRFNIMVKIDDRGTVVVVNEYEEAHATST